MVETAKKAVELVIWIAEGRHASTVGVFFSGLAGAWYLGDLGVTGMPPRWILLSAAIGFTFVVYLLNEARKELREAISNG